MKKNWLYFLIVGLVSVYALGIVLPLMQNDSAQFAWMSMRMHLENDYLRLIKGNVEYLDKPHMHYWLAALSYKLFGISSWSYRIPGLLFIGIGSLSAYQLCRLYKDNSTALMAGLLTACFQTVILMGHDMRTDAVLMGSTSLGVYLLTKYFLRGYNWHLLFGAVAMGISFSTKGQVGVIIGALIVLSLIIGTPHQARLASPKLWIVGLLSFLLAISPSLYAYHHQFGWEGVGFIFWGQSVDRISGTGAAGSAASPEYFFFWHTVLWAFLPIGLLLYVFKFINLKRVYKERTLTFEARLSLGVLIILLLISTSQFKLPHYLNILSPFFAIIGAVGLKGIQSRPTVHRITRGYAWFQSVVLMGLMTLLAWKVFSPNLLRLILITLSLLLAVVIYRKITHEDVKLFFLLTAPLIISNLYMNSTFYPQLLSYQGSHQLAKYYNDNIPPENKVYKIGDNQWSFDFYTKNIHPNVSLEQFVDQHKSQQLALVKSNDYEKLKSIFEIEQIATCPNYHVTKLSLDFLNRETRASVIDSIYLVKVQ